MVAGTKLLDREIVDADQLHALFDQIFGAVRGEQIDATLQNPSWGGAAGAIISTTHDANKFLKALVRGRLGTGVRNRDQFLSQLEGVYVDIVLVAAAGAEPLRRPQPATV